MGSRNTLHSTLLKAAGACVVVPLAWAEIEVRVDEPAYTFAANGELTLDRDAKIVASEYALAEQLRPALEAGNYVRALRLIDSSAQAATGEPPSAALLLLAAQLRALKGDYASAIEDYKLALVQIPQLATAHSGLGTLYLINDQHELAQRALARAVQYGASDVQTYAQLGYLNLRLSNPWSAVNAYERALMLEPDNEAWQRGLLSALSAAGHNVTARTLLREILESRLDDASLWQQRANLALMEDDPLTALASLEVSLRLGDKNSANRLAAAQLHLSHGSRQRASELLQQNLAAGELDVASLYPIIETLREERDYSAASELLVPLLRSGRLSRAESALAYLLRGKLARDQGEQQVALGSFRRAVELDPTNGAALVALGRLYVGIGDVGRAALAFERAEVIPEHARAALLGRAQVAIERRDYTTALKLLREASSKFPGEASLDRHIDSLVNLTSAVSP